MRFFKKTSKHLQMSTNMHILVTPNKKKKKANGYIYVLKQRKHGSVYHMYYIKFILF